LWQTKGTKTVVSKEVQRARHPQLVEGSDTAAYACDGGRRETTQEGSLQLVPIGSGIHG